jgi:RimJ/RimL family protein N-acetyltransferase
MRVMPSVDSERLLLRPLEEGDVRPFMEIHQDPEVMRYILPGAPPGGMMVAWRNVAMMIGHWHLRGYGQWAVVEKATGELIGRVGLWNPEGWPGVELGWVIRRSSWGHGFATEAARAALQWAWDSVETDHIISIIQPENTRSIRVAEKIGEQFERTDILHDRPVHIYGIHRSASNRVLHTK